MNSTDDLFADQGPEYAPQPDRLEVVAGKVVATMNKPSHAQKLFNGLMTRIDEAQTLAARLRLALDTHGRVHRQAMDELLTENELLCKRMLVLLDQRIQAPSKPSGLTPKQKQQAIHLVLGLCEQLEPPQDAEVEAIRARYADADDAALDLREQARELAESFVGADFAQGREFNSPEEVIRAAVEFEKKKLLAQAEKRDAKRTERKAQKGPTPAEAAAEQVQLDAQTALRTVYRQLASALHPDREPDEDARKRKTTLMSEVNAAYERKDLRTLLRIQLQAEEVDANKVGALSDAKLKAMNVLLNEQLKALEMDNRHLRNGMEYEFGYPCFVRFKEAGLLATMLEERTDLQGDLAQMRADLEVAQDEKGLKAWLKEQARANKAVLRQQQVPDMDDVLFAMMRQR
ncbi:MAG: hypothetical protein CFE43_01640 [Burkholderiales bacterium PBB3]|nr:MAG: hypothetical protein CFE43_01640 [Burkholderiales bacterium PBB3]